MVYVTGKPLSLKDDVLTKSFAASFPRAAFHVLRYRDGDSVRWQLESSLTGISFPEHLSICESDNAQAFTPTHWVVRHFACSNHQILFEDPVDSIERFPIEMLLQPNEFFSVKTGKARSLRPQTKGLISIEIATNSERLAVAVASWLNGRVKSIPTATFCLAEELPYLVRPAIDSGDLPVDTVDVFSEIEREPELLLTHALISGRTGSGKTNTALLLLEKVLKCPPQGLFIIDPFDSYRVFASRHGILYIDVDANLSILKSLGVNPLVPSSGQRLSSHLDLLARVIAVAGFGSAGATLPNYLKKVLQEFYIYMWNIDEENVNATFSMTGEEIRKKGGFNFPGGNSPLRLLRTWWKKNSKAVMEKVFDGQTTGELSNLRAVLNTRIDELPDGILGQFDWLSKWGIDCLLDCKLIISLKGLSETESILLMGYLSSTMVEAALGLPGTKKLRNLVVLDEAHLVMKRSQTQNAEFVSAEAGLSAIFSKAFRMLRSRGCGLIVLDQNFNSLIPEVFTETDVKLIHRLDVPEANIQLQEYLKEVPVALQNLQTGQAILFFKNRSPRLITVSEYK